MSRAAALAAVLAACSSAPATPDAPSSPWSEGPKLPLARLEPGVTALGQQLVVAGGFVPNSTGGFDITTQIDVLDTTMCASASATSCTWSAKALPDLPVPLHHIQLAAIGSSLYLLGGLGAPDASNNYPAHGDVYRLDTLDPGAAWVGPADGIPQIPAGYERGSAGVLVVGSRIYLIGGASTTDALATNIYYDTALDAWCPGMACPSGPTMPDLPAKRSHPAVSRRSDGAYVVTGGLLKLAAQDGAGATTWQLTADESKWTTQTWQPTAAMPTPRGGCAYGTVQGQLVCAGGEADTSAFKITESYDPINDVWSCAPADAATGCTHATSSLADMPASTAGTQGAAIAQRLWVPGGSRSLPAVLTGAAPVDTLYVFSPLDTGPGL